jgi:hypothetical protein
VIPRPAGPQKNGRGVLVLFLVVFLLVPPLPPGISWLRNTRAGGSAAHHGRSAPGPASSSAQHYAITIVSRPPVSVQTLVDERARKDSMAGRPHRKHQQVSSPGRLRPGRVHPVSTVYLARTGIAPRKPGTWFYAHGPPLRHRLRTLLTQAHRFASPRDPCTATLLSLRSVRTETLDLQSGAARRPPLVAVVS